MLLADKNASSPALAEAVSVDQVRDELRRITDSSVFADARRLRQFIVYVVEESLAGRADRIKGFTVAQDVFHRDDSGDVQTSTIVRVEAGRLRRRLIEYYSQEGRSNPLRITMPKGGYVPNFKTSTDTVATEAGPIVEVAPGTAQPQSKPAPHPAGRFLLAGIAVVAATIVVWWFAGQSVPRNEIAAESTVVGKPAIVVLPFSDETGSVLGIELAAGLAEDIVTDLSRVHGLDVIALSSAKEVLRENIAPGDIGELLGVSHVLRGSIRGQAPNFRVTAQLFETQSNRQVWAQRFDRNSQDLLTVQSELSRKVIDGMSASISDDPQQGTVTPHLVADEARLLYRQAMDLVNPPGDPRRLLAARQAFEHAIEVDPKYASAYAGLAYTHVFAALFGHSDSQEVDIGRATAMAKLALSLDDSVGLAYTTLAFAELVAGNNDKAVQLSADAVAAQPGDSYLNAYHAFLLAADGQAEQGVAYAEQAIRLDPLNIRSPYMNILGYVSFYAGEYQKSIDSYTESEMRGGPSTAGHRAYVVAANIELDRFNVASDLLKKLDAESPNNGWADDSLRRRFRRAQDRDILVNTIGQFRINESRAAN